jgi:hypothetical protein
MTRHLVSAVAAALILTLSGTAQAGSHGSSHSSGQSYHSGSHGSMSHSHARTNSYHKHYGHKFRHGYYYSGPNHHHWTYRSWYGRYGCYSYWCPSTLCWYYWCAPQNCYYPTSYIGNAPPGATDAPPVAGLAGLTTPPDGPDEP